MRLTDKSRWRYSASRVTQSQVKQRIQRDEWIRIAREMLPASPMQILELGCAPGVLSAALILERPWLPFGIDFSDDADTYVETLRSIGVEPTLYKGDIFDFDIDRQFDVVCSFGLIEHFRGSSLDTLLAIHDRYLRGGGYLIICVPNFTGAQYIWHYLFDRADLDKHNIDVMQPATFMWFEERGYRKLFCDYAGQFRIWGNSSWSSAWLSGKAVAALSKVVNALSGTVVRLGLKLRGRSFSPYLLYVARKPMPLSGCPEPSREE